MLPSYRPLRVVDSLLVLHWHGQRQSHYFFPQCLAGRDQLLPKMLTVFQSCPFLSIWLERKGFCWTFFVSTCRHFPVGDFFIPISMIYEAKGKLRNQETHHHVILWVLSFLASLLFSNFQSLLQFVLYMMPRVFTCTLLEGIGESKSTPFFHNQKQSNISFNKNNLCVYACVHTNTCFFFPFRWIFLGLWPSMECPGVQWLYTKKCYCI